MDRGFLSGLAAGLVLIVGGGIVVSELAPPPVTPLAAGPAVVKPVMIEPTVDQTAVAPSPETAKPQIVAAPDAKPAPRADPVAPAPISDTDAAAMPDAPAKAMLATDAVTSADGQSAAMLAPEPPEQAPDPATPKSPVASAEPAVPITAAPLATVAANAPETPALPTEDSAQPLQSTPEKPPLPQVGDGAADLMQAAAVFESALPKAGAWAESPKMVLPGVVALPTSDRTALTQAPAAKPAASSQTGAAPAVRAPDLASGAVAAPEQAARIGDAASGPQQPGVDSAPMLVADPAPALVEPAIQPSAAADGEAQPVQVAEAEPVADPATDQPPLEPATEKPGILTLTDPGMPNGANAPKPGFAEVAPGVKIIRPSTSKPLPDARADAAAPETQALPALVRNAADFANPDGKPLMSVILIDDGFLDPAKITGLGFPVTIALDPTRPGAPKAAATYRAAGLEVLILATELPDGATASDLEVTFQSHFNVLPQAVGVLDLPLAGFQHNRVLAQQIIAILGDGGYGLVTIDKGLNPAAQVAEREKLAQARVFRELDAGGETVLTIRRSLDRAAFRGAQEGSVVVLGHSSADTLQALVEWAAEGRAANMALCPISAAMSGI